MGERAAEEDPGSPARRSLNISVLRKDPVFKCFVCEKEVSAHLEVGPTYFTWQVRRAVPSHKRRVKSMAYVWVIKENSKHI